MLNRIFKFSSLFALALVFVLTSCDKENLDELTTENFTVQAEDRQQAPNEERGNRGERGNNGTLSGRCFSIVFPVILNFPDGTTAEVADKAAARVAKTAWKEANPDSEEGPSIAIPFDVLLKDSTTLTVTSEEDLADLKETCSDKDERDGRGERCFFAVFPLTINFPDGTSVEVADKATARTAKREWRMENPDSEEKPTIAYPYDVELTDGTTVTLTSDEEVAALKESCNEEEADAEDN